MIIHTVKKGETLFSIAKEYAVPYNIIAALNGFEDPSRLSVGQAVIIREPKELYTVEESDTLYKISRKFSKSILTLLRNNPQLNGLSDIKAGDTLVIEYEEDRKSVV